MFVFNVTECRECGANGKIDINGKKSKGYWDPKDGDFLCKKCCKRFGINLKPIGKLYLIEKGTVEDVYNAIIDPESTELLVSTKVQGLEDEEWEYSYGISNDGLVVELPDGVAEIFMNKESNELHILLLPYGHDYGV